MSMQSDKQFISSFCIVSSCSVWNKNLEIESKKIWKIWEIKQNFVVFDEDNDDELVVIVLFINLV